jgi:hypothetical protein
MACVSCGDRLILDVDNGDTNLDEEIPDDLELPCGCHYLWQCLLDDAAKVAVSLKCPSCEAYLPSNDPGPSVTNPIFHISQGVTIPTRYHSEGGLQENYDILPDLTEEAYLLSHPEARPARAFHTMCGSGDVMGMMSIISDAPAEAGPGILSQAELLRYQDPLDVMQSGLHIAVEKDQKEAFYLLLFLSSRLPTSQFPLEILQSAELVGLKRLESLPNPDIRSLKDEKGDTAEAYALRAGGAWGALVEAGTFTKCD